jgi:hypothetical protein
MPLRGTPRASASVDQMRNVQRSARGGGEWATGCAFAKRASCGPAGKSIRLTRQSGAETADNSFATGVSVIGCSAVPSEITQQGVAAQQTSETEAWCESGEQHRALGA